MACCTAHAPPLCTYIPTAEEASPDRPADPRLSQLQRPAQAGAEPNRRKSRSAIERAAPPCLLNSEALPPGGRSPGGRQSRASSVASSFLSPPGKQARDLQTESGMRPESSPKAAAKESPERRGHFLSSKGPEESRPPPLLSAWRPKTLPASARARASRSK